MSAKDPAAVFEIAPQVTGGNLAAFFMQYNQILGAISDKLNGGWSFDIMLDRLVFVSNCLDFASGKCWSF